MTRRQYAGGAARTTISGSIASSGGGTVTIASATGWPDGSIGKFYVVVDPGASSEEKILCDFLVGTTITYSAIGRGADGTVATSHSAGATIWHCITAVDIDEANAHINAAASAHAASAVTFSPTGNIAATTVQAAIAEVDSETDTRLDTIEAANWVTQSRMADASVGTAELIDANVTYAKLEAITRCALTRSSVSLGAGVGANVTWDVEVADASGFIVVPTTVATVPSGKGGVYVVDFRADPASSISQTIYLIINSDLLVPVTVTAGGSRVSWSGRLVATDTIAAFWQNNSGGAVNFTGSLNIERVAL